MKKRSPRSASSNCFFFDLMVRMSVSLADVPNIVYIFSSVNSIYTENEMGRKKVWDERILLPLKTETLELIDADRKEGEDRVSWIRDAIDRKLKRRKSL